MSLTIALDVMGGDKGPDATLRALIRQHEQLRDVHYLLFGDEAVVLPFLRENPNLKKQIDLVHTTEFVLNETKPLDALRRLKKSSMRLAILSVAEGKADAVVSSGNTGAYMALSKMIIDTLDGIDRPAIATFIPTSEQKSCLVLDLGANVDCTPKNFVDFALMGQVFSRCMLGLSNPTVGILNIGSEEFKGTSLVQEAALLIKANPHINYKGFVEGDDISFGTVDIVVTDGFSGNIALKVAEGTAKFIKRVLEEEIRRSIISKLGALLLLGAFKRLKARIDPRVYNGAIFIGLQKPVIKSHGGVDAIGFQNAVRVAANMVKGQFYETLRQELQSDLAKVSAIKNER